MLGACGMLWRPERRLVGGALFELDVRYTASPEGGAQLCTACLGFKLLDFRPGLAKASAPLPIVVR